MNAKTIAGWAALAFVVWWILVNPSGADHLMHNIGGLLASAAHGISSFFSSI